MTKVEWDVQVGRRLRSAMVLAGLRTGQVAETMGLHQLTVQRHMRGDTAADSRQLAAYAATFGCSVNDLLPPAEAPSDSNRQPTDCASDLVGAA